MAITPQSTIEKNTRSASPVDQWYLRQGNNQIDRIGGELHWCCYEDHVADLIAVWRVILWWGG
jgi:hypothetical protein